MNWKRLICNNSATPKSKFIMCMALLDRLATADIVSKCSSEFSPLCKLCNTDDESVHHLFFLPVPYSKEMWCKVLSYLGFQPQGNAQSELELANKRACCKKDRSKLFVMMYT